MDPVTVTGLLGSIIQVANLGLSTISWCHKVYKDGRDYHEIADASQRFHTAVTGIEKMLGPLEESTNLDPAERALFDCAKDCAASARTLVFELAKYDICEDKGRLKQLFVVGLRRLCKTSKVNALRDQLETHKKALDTSLLVDIRQRTKHVDLDQLLRLQQERGVSLDILQQISRLQQSLQHVSITGFSNLARQIQELQVKFCDTSCYEQIMRTLFFPQMSLRLEEVSHAHRRTFEWIWDPSFRKSLQYDFMHWLQYESGMFWISGKLGSGKSTFMKFIHGHDKTAELLSTWAEPGICCRSAFFLWNNGQHNLQKSIRGLLRTILYDFLTEIPSAIDALESDTSGNVPTWSEQRLMNAIKSVMGYAERRFFIMIDGLDEVDGNTQDLINCVVDLSRAGAKLCVSGRPWNQFERAFTGPSMRLHELTKSDISRFVGDRIDSCLYNNPLLNVQPSGLHNLKILIEARAEGVFLWAKVVTNICATGIEDGEDLEDLHHRVSDLPIEMRELFSRVLERIKRQDPSRGMEYIARYLRLLSSLKISVNMLTLAFTSLSCKKNLRGIQSREPEQVAILCLRAHAQLRAKCGGLLEIDGFDQDLRDKLSEPKDLEWIIYSDRCLIKHPRNYIHYLRFVHRTAEDFLNEEVVTTNTQHSMRDYWNPCIALAEAHIEKMHFLSQHWEALYSRELTQSHYTAGNFAKRMTSSAFDAIDYLRVADVEDDESGSELIGRIFAGASGLFNTGLNVLRGVCRTEVRLLALRRAAFFGAIADEPVELSAYWHVSKPLRTQMKSSNSCPSRLLYCAVIPLRQQRLLPEFGLWSLTQQSVHRKFVVTHQQWLYLCEMLIVAGADPNIRDISHSTFSKQFVFNWRDLDFDLEGESPWIALLKTMTSHWGCGRCEVLHRKFYDMWMRTFEVMIDRAGAHVNAILRMDALGELDATSFYSSIEYIKKRRFHKPATVTVSNALWVELSPLSMLQTFFRGELSLKLQQALRSRGGGYHCHLYAWDGFIPGDKKILVKEELDINLTELYLWRFCSNICDQELKVLPGTRNQDSIPPAARTPTTPGGVESVEDVIKAVGEQIYQKPQDQWQPNAPNWLQPPIAKHEDKAGKNLSPAEPS